MIYSMIDGIPFLYQSTGGTVYHVADAITTITSWSSRNGDIDAYVDTDEKNFVPQRFICCLWIKIIAATSPKGTDQHWMKQTDNAPIAFATKLWTESELLMTGFVISPRV